MAKAVWATAGVLLAGVGGCSVDQYAQAKHKIEVGVEVFDEYNSFGDIDLGSTSWFGLGGDDTLRFSNCPELAFEARNDAAGKIVLWLVDSPTYSDHQVSPEQVAVIC